MKFNYEKKYSMPYSISYTALEKIFGNVDSLAAEIGSERNEKRNELIDNNVKRLLESNFSANEARKLAAEKYEVIKLSGPPLKIRIVFTDLSEIELDSCKSISGNQHISDKSIRKINIQIVGVGDCNFSLEIDRRFCQIESDCLPQGNEKIIRLYNIVHEEIQDLSPGLVKKIWFSQHYLHNFIGSFLIFTALLYAAQTKTVDNTKEELFKIADGAKGNIDVQLAMEKIAIIMSGRSDISVKFNGLTPRLTFFILSTMAIMAALSYMPRLTLELGHDRREYRVRNRYERVVMIAIPGYIAATFFLPWISSYIQKILGY